MKQEYIIINKFSIEQRIRELEIEMHNTLKERKGIEDITVGQKEKFNKLFGERKGLKEILSNSTPLQPYQDYINLLRSSFFEGWHEKAISGYLTALGSLEAKLHETTIKTL